MAKLVKDTELGQLPIEWNIQSLGQLIERPQYGLTTSAVGKKVGPQFLRITDIQEGGVDWSAVPFCACSQADIYKYRINSGDMVVARIGATTGKTYLVVEPPIAVFASYLIKIRTKPHLLPEFLYHFTKSSSYWQQINATKGGRLKQGVNIPVLQNLKVPVPAIPEQRAIAQVLRTVQRAKAATEKVIAAARQLKQSLMRHLFTYGPVPFQEADRVELQETDYGSFPIDWECSPLRKYAEVQTGVAKGRKNDVGDSITLPYLRVANVQDGYLDLAEMKYLSIRRSEVNRFSLRRGDVVLTEGGDFDKLGRGFIWNEEVANCIHQNHIFAVRANRERLLPEFLAYMTQSNYGKKYFLLVAHKTTNLACINTTKLKAFPVLIPPMEEQKEIAEILAIVDKKIALEETKRTSLGTLFNTLLHFLMTGQIRVHDLDPPFSCTEAS